MVVGVVETHGRQGDRGPDSTDLEVLPRKPIDYRGRTLMEFDLDAALARRPELLLVDEYAHSNAPGSRHPKRWQDVEELLAAGINVWTTLNVQHLESLVDVVWKITGVRQRETVPDSALVRRRRDRARRHHPGRAAPAPGRGQGLRARDRAPGGDQLLQAGEPDRPARTGPAPRRPDRRRPAGRRHAPRAASRARGRRASASWC